ncbi:MAG TPA: class I SAM-dependent methyltransferase [Gaiellaceae bacterium]|nr:class I SAM-dependent methyltransferase [Gaiellaceae bacterium]
MSLVELLTAEEEAWTRRPLLRRLYRDWFEEIGRRLSPVPGETVELGSGIGKLQEHLPFVVATDIEPTPWAERVVDASRLPFADASLANLVLFDVFHHLADPARFLDEARRTLAPGGRLVVLDPYCSPVSTPAYRLFHPERTDLSAPAFDREESIAADPLASNQARATLVFFRRADELRRGWPDLRILERRRLALLAYPLSGGFFGRPLAPAAAYRPLAAAERVLAPLAPLLAFRCLVVLERL